MRRIYVLTDEEATLFGATARGLGCSLRDLLAHLEWVRGFIKGPPPALTQGPEEKNRAHD